MNQKHVYAHSLWLMAAVCVAFILAQWLGAIYDAEIIAVLFVIYMAVRSLNRKKSQLDSLNQTHILDASIFTIIVLTVVLTTGGISSVYFFLMYFLMFGIALLVEPIASLFVTTAVIALFIPGLPSHFTAQSVLPLLTLPLMVPFALYVGSSYRKREELLQQAIQAQQEKAYSEEDALIFISTVVRTHVGSILETADVYDGDRNITEIRASARRLQKLIDKFEQFYR